MCKPVPKILNIQRFSLDDGPGIRTTVFLKGCPLSCIWCHNPESQELSQELSFNTDNCRLCARCADICPMSVHNIIDGRHDINRVKCGHCGKCAGVCPNHALEIYGKNMTVSEITDIVMQDKVFYAENGGLTISGGEPLLFPEFTLELAASAKANGIKVAVETGGFGKKEDLGKLLPYVDLWLFDYKAGNNETHKKLCGAENITIHDNFLFLTENNADIIITYPIIPGINDTDEDFRVLKELIQNSGRKIPVRLLPYHVLGKAKADNLGKKYSAALPNENTTEDHISKLKQRNSDITIIES